MNTVLRYHHTFEGFLTAIFEAYRLKITPIDITSGAVSDMFVRTLDIQSEKEKAERVLAALINKSSRNFSENIYKAFLSELPQIEMSIFRLMKKIFISNSTIEYNYGDKEVLHISSVSRQVDKEVHRMHAFVRFEKCASGIFISRIEPVFNVVPLIGKHFEERYADQEWIIYDVKRNSGLHYNLEVLVPVSEINPAMHKDAIGINGLAEEEAYQNLWKKYILSVNIPERKNTKLQKLHMPKKYWKYLTEKK